MILTGETEVLGENLWRCYVVHHTSFGLAWDGTRVSVTRSRRQTAWATAARPTDDKPPEPWQHGQPATNRLSHGSTARITLSRHDVIWRWNLAISQSRIYLRERCPYVWPHFSMFLAYTTFNACTVQRCAAGCIQFQETRNFMLLDWKETRLGLDDSTSPWRRIFLYKLIFVQLLKKLSRFLVLYKMASSKCEFAAGRPSDRRTLFQDPQRVFTRPFPTWSNTRCMDLQALSLSTVRWTTIGAEGATVHVVSQL